MKTIRIAFLLGASMLVIGSAAQAADPVIDVPEVYDWSGIYLGVHAGYAWGETEGTDINGWISPFPDVASSLTADGDGLTAGGQIGYNMQMDSLVFGVEADLSYLDVSGSETSSVYPDNHVVSDDGYLGTLRARLGFAADRFMIYGTGGLAVGDTGSKWVDNGGGTQFELDTNSQWGWVAGGGVEYAATDSISVKAEYLYYDLGTENLHYGPVPNNYCTPNGVGCDFEIKNTGSIVRLGVNFHF
jgi:outer membrane immunogenic protein